MITGRIHANLQIFFCVVAVLVGLTGGALAQNVAAILRANQAAVGAPPSHAVVARTTYAFVGMGLTGQYTSTDDLRDGRFVNALVLGPITQVQGFDGQHAWQKDASGSITQQDGGEQRQSAVSEAYRQANLWWRDDVGGARLTAEGQRRENGRSMRAW
jgi:hypothetical protein